MAAGTARRRHHAGRRARTVLNGHVASVLSVMRTTGELLIAYEEALACLKRDGKP